MPHSLGFITIRRFTTIALLALAGTLTACGGSGDTAPAPTKSSPAETAPATKLDKKTDTAATAKSASAAKVPADQLKTQSAAIERGLSDAGLAPNNVGAIGGAKADIVVDTSWAVYVYESDRAAAEFALSIRDIRSDPANYRMFRIGNRIYYVSMTSALTSTDTAKLDKIADAAEGAIAAG